MLRGVKLLVIDEMSMLSAYHLGMIHDRMPCAPNTRNSAASRCF